MARYAISAEGAASLRALGTQLFIQANCILEASSLLASRISAINEGLGIYGDDILCIIQQGCNLLNSKREDIIGLAQRVQEKANEIEELVSLGFSGENNAEGNSGIYGRKGALEPTRSTPRDLAASEYGFNKADDGNLVYDSPLQMDQYMYKTQGSAYREFQGTCGLCSCANILRLAGVNASEKDVVDYAANTGDPSTINRKLCCTGYLDYGHNGGTTAKQRQLILENFGVSSSIFNVELDPKLTATDGSINQIADWVSNGQGVILDVHARTLWFDEKVPPNYPDGHAVTAVSVKKDSNGGVLGFYICDSARGGTEFYTTDKLKQALRGTPANVTTQIIR